jgi:hypothetical protein
VTLVPHFPGARAGARSTVRRRALPGPLREAIASELPSSSAAAEAMIAATLRAQSFDAALVRKLAGAARGRGGEERGVRLLACLLAELQVRIAAPRQAGALVRALFECATLPQSLHLEGFPTGGPELFVAALQRKVSRFESLHAAIHGFETQPDALRALIRRIDRETSLVLARWWFTPKEVAAEILSRVRVSTGISGAQELEQGFVGEEIAETLRRLPAYEREIVRQLTRDGRVLWVGDDTPSVMNGLVEYPAGTVVLVMKAPGSDLELEVKRAGLRGTRPLDVRLNGSDGKLLPRHHHFWGGSMGSYLAFEARGAAAIARLYRAVHDEEPPVSRVLTRTMILTVPVPGGEETILDYFDDAALHGEDFARMRHDMPRVNAQIATRALYDELHQDPTGLFVLSVSPHQSLLAGTSSFRLDRLHAALGENNVQTGLEVLDQLLDEILAPYAPPRGPFASNADFVAAAFAANRTAADAAHLGAVTQLAKLWGTLVAAGGNSEGESFVTRNVGLRKVWRGGAWRVELISMDHDALDIPARNTTDFRAEWTLSGTLRDRAHIVGGQQKHRSIPGSLATLDAIYRLDPALAASRRTRFMELAVAAFLKTREAMESDPRVRAMFKRQYVERMLTWESCARELLSGKPLPAWKRAVRKQLREWPRAESDELIRAATEYRDLLPLLAPFYCT